MSTRRGSGAAGAVTGLASLLALAVLVAGIPAALYAVGGSPIPHAIPSWHQVTATLGRPDHGTLLLAAIRWVSWLAWAVFTISALVEVFAQVWGRAAPRLPVISPVQGFAAALVGTAILGLLPAPHLLRPAPLPPRPAQAVATAPPHPSQPAWATPTAAADPLRSSARPGSFASPPATPHREVYRVVEGDNLWDIAARRLGDGERWHEIYALNRGTPQPGGGSLTDPSLIYPGWILLLPAPASGYAHTSAPGHQPSQTPPGQLPGRNSHHPARPRHEGRAPHTVRPLAPVTPGRGRPAGIHLPGGGLVGITLAAAISTALVAWRLHRRRTAVPRWPIRGERAEPPLPDAITRLRRAHLQSMAAAGAEARGEPWLGDEDPGAAEPDGHGEAGENGDGLDEFGAPTGPAAWRPADPESAGPATARHPVGPGRAGGGGWAAEGTAGGPLPAPLPPTAPAGNWAGPGPAGSPGDPEETMAGWRPAPPPGPPLPVGTVAFGMRDGTEIPLPAVAGRGLGLTGPGAPDAARALLVGLLAAASVGRRQPGAQVVIPVADIGQLVGDHQETQIPGVVPGLPDGLIIAPGLAGALDHIETEITYRSRLLGAGGDGDLSAPEPSGTTREMPLPSLALIATVDRASARRVQAVLEAGARAGVVGVVLGDWAAGTTCRISADGTVLAATDAGLAGAEAFHLPAPDAATMLGLLRGAQGHVTADTPGTPGTGSGREPGAVARPAGPPHDHTDDAPGGDHASPLAARQRAAAPPPPGQDRAASPQPKPQAAPPAGGPVAAPGDAGPQARRSAVSTLSTGIGATVTRPVHIAVLGPLEVTALGREVRGGLRKARELLAYLALHPEGATGEAISEALWPESGPRYATAQRNLALRKARQMLRTATGLSQPMFIILASERYRFDPALIDVDLWRFEAALDQARTTAGEGTQLAVLQQAAALYHGPLVDGAAYDWAERYAEPARRRAVDALARIAEILQPTDPEQSLTTLEAALAHDPYNEAVYHKIMHIQDRLGRPDAARRTLRLLETRLAELGLSPDPATRQAATGATGNQPGHPPSRRRS